MDLAPLEKLVSMYGPFAALLLVIIYFLWKALETREKNSREDAKEDKKVLMDLVSKSTSAIDNNTNAMNAVVKGQETLTQYVHEALTRGK